MTDSLSTSLRSVPTAQDDAMTSQAGNWTWWASRDEEQYLVGPCGSREEAIERATEDFDGEAFHVVEARKGSMARWLPKADRIIEIMSEASDDDGAFGEDAYCELIGSPEAISAAEADLSAALADWFSRHAAIFPEPWVFAATRNGEWFQATGTPTPHSVGIANGDEPKTLRAKDSSQ